VSTLCLQEERTLRVRLWVQPSHVSMMARIGKRDVSICTCSWVVFPIPPDCFNESKHEILASKMRSLFEVEWETLLLQSVRKLPAPSTFPGSPSGVLKIVAGRKPIVTNDPAENSFQWFHDSFTSATGKRNTGWPFRKESTNGLALKNRAWGERVGFRSLPS